MPLENLKKEIINKYNSIRNYAQSKNINYGNINSVLNGRLINKKIQAILKKDFDLKENFFENNNNEETKEEKETKTKIKTKADLKKQIIYKYNSIRNYAQIKNINYTNINSVLNGTQKNNKIQEFLKKDFNLENNFFENNNNNEETKEEKETKTKIKTKAYLKKQIIYDYKNISRFAKEKNITNTHLTSLFTQNRRNKNIEKILIETYNLPQNFFEKETKNDDK